MNHLKVNSNVETNEKVFVMAVEERNWHLKTVNQTLISSQAHKYLQSHVYIKMSKTVRELL